MSKVEDYVMHEKGFISEDICDKLIKYLNSESYSKEWKLHKFYNSVTKESLSRSKKEIENSYAITPYTSIIVEGIRELIPKYQNYTNTTNVWDNYNGFSAIRFNKYKKGVSMTHHCDLIHDLWDPGIPQGVPILSVLGCISEAEEGGSFLMFEKEKKIVMNKGDILLFPSNFMYPHSVTPVSKGERISFVSWVW
jgi:hypothetical protein